MDWLTYPARRMRSEDAKALFGIGPKEPLPDCGLPARRVAFGDDNVLDDGVTVWVAPLERGHFKLRVMCECPRCHAHMPLSRLFQHRVVHGGERP